MFFLLVFAVATFLIKTDYNLYLAAAEGVAILALLIYSLISRRRKGKALKAYIDSVTYDTENAKNNTLMNFPLPIVVFRLDDSRIIWGNEKFFSICGEKTSRSETNVAELIPEFSGKWLVEGKSQCPDIMEVGGRKYQIYGNIVRPGSEDGSKTLMGIAYWTDVTEFDELRREHDDSRPVAAVFVIDNLDELLKNQPERIRNDLRDEIGEKLQLWCEDKQGVLRRYDRDRYLFIFEERYLREIIESRFGILQTVHEVVSPSGIHATLSIGIGREGASFSEILQFAELSAEMALSRGGDQAVIKNRFDFEFYGGKAGEIETRTKVRSRVMANAIAALIQDASRVLVMGHRYSDMDSIGASVAVCAIAKKFSVPVFIVADTEKSSAKPLIKKLKDTPEYQHSFISPQEAMLIADARTLLVVVDTNRPEQVEDMGLLQSCNKVAVIDHHRRAATYIDNADLSFVETYASSACELLTEVIEVVMEGEKLLRCEAEAILAGIVLDTKSFTMRTGDRTFDAAAVLRRNGADTTEVKKLLQSNVEKSVARYRIMQNAGLYRSIAIAAPETPQDRIVAAQAADELLNISGVEASMVIYPLDNGDVFVSARSIGEVNVQIIMEKLGGGGNRASAAAQIKNRELKDALTALKKAIDEYFES
ncbi:MAG: DHH family phosphoesterase [Oscillospiraceae bacterium]|nr:DHH family phosphoesterase [Oscillospiraceae bacterium]